MTQTQVDRMIDELAEDWAERFSGLTPGEAIFLLEVLSSLPGAQSVADIVAGELGESPPVLGWVEWRLIRDLINVVGGPTDVARFCERFLNRINSE
jgi:hypothetical protein